ncbi:MAG: 2-amino-4-hydroxy-6-hydroxymethyldihydropteridine diphosphokinase [Chitinophagaceae bacterium]|nr:2-amino-4-hydroxy-6-hydroxymethyldihydropteridine diphosphokinase [Chitinophagaceae bacterium]
MSTVYLLTGSNLGDSAAYLAEAASQIEQKLGKIVRRSSLYETAPWGNIHQPAFLNQVLVLETSSDPEPLMHQLLEIENNMGRKRTEKYGPRTIDIDQLFFDDKVYNSDLLVLPHPEIQHRRFVLVPLQEVAPQFIHPVLQKNITALLANCSDHSNVQKKLLL